MATVVRRLRNVAIELALNLPSSTSPYTVALPQRERAVSREAARAVSPSGAVRQRTSCMLAAQGISSWPCRRSTRCPCGRFRVFSRLHGSHCRRGQLLFEVHHLSLNVHRTSNEFLVIVIAIDITVQCSQGQLYSGSILEAKHSMMTTRTCPR